MLREIVVTIPPILRDRAIILPSAFAALVEDSTKAISALDNSHGSSLQALSALLLRTETVASSKIERIAASMDDYARALHGSKASAAATAMVRATHATDSLMRSVSEDRTITSAAILGAHHTLMSSDPDPAERESAGRLRDMQNWVEGSDYSPRGATLIPPPADLVEPLFDDLVEFANRSDLPSLLQGAIAHAQFETLHPFTDGNGRIGRALVNAILRARGTTTRVVVPLASAFVARRDAYFASLDAYRLGDLEPILTDFCLAARVASEESAITAQRLDDLPREWLLQVGRSRAGGSTRRVLDLLMTEPVVVSADIQRHLGSSESATFAAIERLTDAGVLRPLTDRKRDQVWGASAVLDELDDLSGRIEARARHGA